MSFSSQSKSTARRKKKAQQIFRNGDTAMRPCDSCQKEGRVCKVHISSGRCSECWQRNLKSCNARVTEGEWKRLSLQRKKLLQELDAAKRILGERQDALMEAHAKEMRLRKQLDAVDQKVAEGRSLEDRLLLDEDPGAQEYAVADADPSAPNLSLSPWTWSAVEGLPDDFWLSPSGETVPSVAQPSPS